MLKNWASASLSALFPDKDGLAYYLTRKPSPTLI